MSKPYIEKSVLQRRLEQRDKTDFPYIARSRKYEFFLGYTPENDYE